MPGKSLEAPWPRQGLGSQNKDLERKDSMNRDWRMAERFRALTALAEDSAVS